MHYTSISFMINHKNGRFTQGFVWRSSAGCVASSGWAWHGGTAEQKVGGCVVLSSRGRLPLSAVNTLIWQRSLDGATTGWWARKQWLQREIEYMQKDVFYIHYRPLHLHQYWQLSQCLSEYLVFTCSGWRAVKCDELLQVFLQAGLGSVPLGWLGAPEIGPELRLATQ